MVDSSKLPLKGVGVLVTRERKQAAQLVSRLDSLGATVYVVPSIETEPMPEPKGLRESLRRITDYDYLVFTSVNGVYYFLEQLQKSGLSAALLPPALCVGPKTAEAWREGGGIVGFIPLKYSASELALALGEDLKGSSLLVLRPEHIKTKLGVLLKEQGCRVDEIILYRTVTAEQNAKQLTVLLDKGDLDVVLFASPSSVEGTLRMAGDRKEIKDLLAVCIGPVTAQAAADRGFKKVLSPDEYTIDNMIELLTIATAETRDRR